MSDAHDDTSPEMLERRAILRRAAWMLGGAVSAPAALAILQGCSAKQTPVTAAAPDLKFLSPAQLDVVAEISDIMIPKTDTSGAQDAGVPAFIDLMLADVYDKAAQDRFSSGFAQFAAGADTAPPNIQATRRRIARRPSISGLVASSCTSLIYCPS